MTVEAMVGAPTYLFYQWITSGILSISIKNNFLFDANMT
jgi:hypothetical protein